MGHNYTQKILKSYKCPENFHFLYTKRQNSSLTILAFPELLTQI